ncbi:MAG: hypothetical protein ACE5F5_06010 [Acidimicrobiia bacterium]
MTGEGSRETVESESRGLTEASRGALVRARSRRGGLRSAIEVVREAVSAGPGDDWYDRLRPGLVELGEALEAHIADIEGPEGLYTDLLVQAPWQGAETEILEAEHQAIQASFEVAFEALEAARESGLADPEPVRQRVETLLERIVLHSEREANLVFEVYDTDIGLID